MSCGGNGEIPFPIAILKENVYNGRVERYNLSKFHSIFTHQRLQSPGKR
jgi:hypothetical protein